MPSVQVYHTTWQLKCPLCRCIRPRGNWNSLYVGVSGQVANKMPSVYVFQTTWQLKCPLCRCIRPRGNWNALCANESDHVAIEMPFCAGVSDYVATELPSVKVYQTTWQLKFPLCRLSEQVATYSKHLPSQSAQLNFRSYESLFLTVGEVVIQSIRRLVTGCTVCINITLGASGIFSFPLYSMSV